MWLTVATIHMQVRCHVPCWEAEVTTVMVNTLTVDTLDIIEVYGI